MADILIVDDEVALRKNLGLVLTRKGHFIREASNGREALHLIADKLPDLLVTDLFMPVKDGIEIIREVRRLHPQLPIIAMSGGLKGDQDVFLKMAEHMGVKATLSKPFSIQDFQAAVEKVLGTTS
jgi:CheY-like chemotaxis protein